MQSIPLDSVAAMLDGHIDCVHEKGSLQPVRYRLADAPFLDPGVIKSATFPGGLRLRLTTNSRTIRLEVQQTLATIPGREWWTADYELHIDGKFDRRVSPIGGAQIFVGGAVTGDPRAILTVDDLPPGEKNIELWLPHVAITAITALYIDDGASLSAWPDTRPRILFHGSSITQAADAESGTLTWPGVASAKANLRHLNLGWAGSCLISGFAGRLLRDEPADAIALELGANIWENGLLKERTFTDCTQALLTIIREKHTVTPIVIVSPIAFAQGDDATNGFGISLGRMRELLDGVVSTRKAAGDANMHYLSGISLSGRTDLSDLPDGIHPNAKGNRIIGERFFEHMLAPGKPLAPPR